MIRILSSSVIFVEMELDEVIAALGGTYIILPTTIPYKYNMYRYVILQDPHLVPGA